MSKSVVASPALPDVTENPQHITERATRPVVLITEQQVAFSTAAAIPMPRTRRRSRILVALHLWSASRAEEPRPAPRHYPPRREAFMEQAAMRREMYRL